MENNIELQEIIRLIAETNKQSRLLGGSKAPEFDFDVERTEVTQAEAGEDNDMQEEQMKLDEEQFQPAQDETDKEVWKEKTEEEKEKWIDEVLKVDEDEDQQHQTMKDEQEEDIGEFEKDFFEIIKKGNNATSQTQEQKRAKFYEEIVGEKHRKVQIIVLTSSSESDSETDSRERNHLKSNSSSHKDFQVKEEYISDEDDDNKYVSSFTQSHHPKKTDNLTQQQEIKNKNDQLKQEKEDEEFKAELGNFLMQELNVTGTEMTDFQNRYMTTTSVNKTAANPFHDNQPDPVDLFDIKYDDEDELEKLFNSLLIR